FQAEDGIRDRTVTGVQTCALPILFSVGAIFPVAPFLFLGGRTAVIASLVASGVALAAIGAGTSLFTGRSVAFSAFRQLLIGYAAAAITYAIGMLAGVTLGG